MASWKPVDISQFDCDDIEDIYGDWDDNFKNNLEVGYNN